ncbi:protein MpMAPKKK11 [Marchantia polymorpha subsp. ruderalis]|uniref:mitogen-activated protein kinase kinase kinase n=2 Tax=Marchantia polymorpha TaxID=3197 RepID=A0AAF6BCN6_MARPO|nr:hypothetical protein MARPO_0020s0024 [Marchantia polymorpha]BBN09770.1 hypothetical protein Mp_4g22540 [Marchantia polymorpha subsp. ruderalis]|eukprot:PTQ44352.1 hypothetical protein MARPO_0020s0024 [Marchantia polymorpha]
MEPGLGLVIGELAKIHTLIDGCSRILPLILRHKSACTDFAYFLKDIGNRLRCKVSSTLSQNRQKDLLGQLLLMSDKLRDAQVLLLSLTSPKFCSETTTDRIIHLRIEILMTLSIITLFMRRDEYDPDATLDDLEDVSGPSLSLLRRIQGSRKTLAKFPPNWKPIHLKDSFERTALSPRQCRHRANHQATSTAPLPDGSTIERFSYPAEIQKVTESINPPWKHVKELGRGGYGIVWLAKDSSDKFFALKELHHDLPTNVNGISFERDNINRLQELNHKHIVRYLGVERSGGKLRIFMELAGKRSLRAFYLAQRLKISEVREFTRQILEALAYVHSKRIVHRDVKCDNVILDDSGTCKLCDFGVARQLLSSQDQAKTQIGSARWMAPEIIRPYRRPDGTCLLGYSKPADIWSLGCTVLEMITGDVPFPEVTNNIAVLYKVGKGSPEVPTNLPEDMKDFLARCLRTDPAGRDTAQELLQHPFIVGLPDLGDLWEAEYARIQELSHPRLKGHAEAVITKNKLQFSRLQSLALSL